jgi:hypothetical protein
MVTFKDLAINDLFKILRTCLRILPSFLVPLAVYHHPLRVIAGSTGCNIPESFNPYLMIELPQLNSISV